MRNLFQIILEPTRNDMDEDFTLAAAYIAKGMDGSPHGVNRIAGP